MGTGADQEPEEPPQSTALPHTHHSKYNVCLPPQGLQGTPWFTQASPSLRAAAAAAWPLVRGAAAAASAHSSRLPLPPRSAQAAAAAAAAAVVPQPHHSMQQPTQLCCHQAGSGHAEGSSGTKCQKHLPDNHPGRSGKIRRLEAQQQTLQTQQGLTALQANYNQRAMQQHGLTHTPGGPGISVDRQQGLTA